MPETKMNETKRHVSLRKWMFNHAEELSTYILRWDERYSAYLSEMLRYDIDAPVYSELNGFRRRFRRIELDVFGYRLTAVKSYPKVTSETVRHFLDRFDENGRKLVAFDKETAISKRGLRRNKYAPTDFINDIVVDYSSDKLMKDCAKFNWD